MISYKLLNIIYYLRQSEFIIANTLEMNSNVGRERRSKIFKDLMITRRDLADLRESIHNNFRSIKHSDQKIMHIEDKRMHSQHFQSAPQINQPAAQQMYLPINSNLQFCQICLCQFERPSDLSLHLRQKHNLQRHSCSDCGNLVTETQQTHQIHYCPQNKTVCQFCKLYVKKIDLDEHMKICGFKECYKCNKKVYNRAYSFHLQQCSRAQTHTTIVPCKKIKHTKLERPLVLPCCLVTQYD